MVPGYLGVWGPAFPSTSFSIPFKLVFNGSTKSRQKEKCQMTFVACVPIVSDASFQENVSPFSPQS